MTTIIGRVAEQKTLEEAYAAQRLFSGYSLNPWIKLPFIITFSHLFQS